MTTATTRARPGDDGGGPRGRARTSARTPEVDAARGLALALATVVLVAPSTDDLPSWLAPSAWHGASVADLLPAALAAVAGLAVTLQRRRHRGRPAHWWLGRAARRLVVLVVLGLVLAGLADPAWPPGLAALRWTSDLARIGLATVVALPLLALPGWARAATATVVVVAHDAVLLRGDGLGPADNALAGVDQRLLGAAHALGPVDPDGVTALLPTLAVVLAGSVVGGWLADRPRGGLTGTTLLLTGVSLWAVGRAVDVRLELLPPNATLWTAPIVLAGLGAAVAVVGAAHLGTRWAPTDVVVAYTALPGREGLPVYVAASLAGLFVAGTSAWRGLVGGLGQGIGAELATVVTGLAVVLLLGRGAGALVDRGVHVRA